MNSTSPPAGVHAKPMATPGSRVRSAISSSRKNGAPSISTTTYGLMTSGLSFPSARRRAAFRTAGQAPDGHDLAGTILRYSERGQDYVTAVQNIMKINNLKVFDNARLAESSWDDAGVRAP